MLWSGLVPGLADEEETLDVEALLADDDLLDALLYGEAELSGETEPTSALWDIEHRLLVGLTKPQSPCFALAKARDP